MNNTEMTIGMKPDVFVDYAIEKKLSLDEVKKYLRSCSEREYNELVSIIKRKVDDKSLGKFDHDQHLTWLLYIEKHTTAKYEVKNKFEHKLNKLGITMEFNEASNYSDSLAIKLSFNGMEKEISSYNAEVDINNILYGVTVGRFLGVK